MIIKRKSELNISEWSGGSTTELFIFPEGSSYQKRDFEFRISSATVEQTPSVFTILPSYQRVLMPLNAPLRLVFEGQNQQNEIAVNPFETVEFDGAKQTASYGLCTDIGVMFSADWQARLLPADSKTYEFNGFKGVYSLSDNIKAVSGGKNYTLNSGDFLLLQADKISKITLFLPHKNAAVITDISKR